MKILMASEDLPGEQVGGLGKHVVTLANALLALGHEVAILGRNDAGADGCAARIGFGGRFIPAFDYSRPNWKESQLGVFNPLKRPWFARKIGRAINAHSAGFDVVHYHGHLPMVGLHVDPALNFVQTRHDQGSECVIHLRFRNGGVCTTTSARDCAGCIHPAPGPLRQGVSAYAVTRYRRDTASAFARHKTIFVSDFLRRQFLRQVPAADLSRCRVIHNFIQYPFLASHAAAPGQVRFLGWNPYPDVIALSARSHICVVPSVWEEPCGTTVLEALALGKQCIALARGGTPELAAYQLYDGQLQLADSMEQLVDILCAQLARAPVTLPLPATFALDVFQAIPKILECYAA